MCLRNTLFWPVCLLIGCLWLLGCAPVKPPENAILTIKRDGSHFYGVVIREDAGTITLTGDSGETRTFLRSELSDIRYANSEAQANSPAAPVKQNDTVTPLPVGGDLFVQAAGTQIAVRSAGFIDSCCVRLNDIELGVLDADIRSPKGVVLLPRGANVTYTIVDQRTDDGRLTMTFELSSADYGGHHYLISSAQGGDQRGAIMTIAGAKDGTPEAAVRGTAIHLDDNSGMVFKAATPVVFKLSL